MDIQDIYNKVIAVNRAHEYANKIGPEIRQFFAPYVGKKILKQGGDFLAKIKESLPKLVSWKDGDRKMNAYYSISRYTVHVHITVREGDRLHETIIYILNVNGLDLEAIRFNSTEFPIYTFDEVVQKMNHIERLELELKEVKNSIFHFVY